MMIEPTVHLYRNRRTGEFRVQPCAREFETPQEFGSPTIIPAEASDDDLLAAILANLPKSETEKYNRLMAPKYSIEDRRRILKEEQAINVYQSEKGYRLEPMKKMRNSFGSIEGMTRIVPRNEFLQKGGEIIRRLFKEIR